MNRKFRAMLLLFTLILSFSLPVRAEGIWSTQITNRGQAYGSVKVIKKLPKETYQKLLESGAMSKAIFSFHLEGDEANLRPYDETETINFTEYTSDSDPSDTENVSMEVVFEEVPYGDYTLTETTSKIKAVGETEFPTDGTFYLDSATASDDGITLSEDKKTATFTIDSSNANVELFVAYRNILGEGSIKVIKKGDYDQKLKGVEFRLSRKETAQEAAEAEEEGDTFTPITLKTNENGEINFENIPYGTYVLTETNTIDGYALLRDQITVTIPYVATEEQVVEQEADITKAIFSTRANAYFFNDLTIDVKNGGIPQIPMTGSIDKKLYILLAIGSVLILGGYIYGQKKKKVPAKVKSHEDRK